MATPGWKTSEFWLSLAAMLVGAIVTSGALTPGSPWEKLVGIAAMVLAAMGYSVSRGIAKSK